MAKVMDCSIRSKLLIIGNVYMIKNGYLKIILKNEGSEELSEGKLTVDN